MRRVRTVRSAKRYTHVGTVSAYKNREIGAPGRFEQQGKTVEPTQNPEIGRAGNGESYIYGALQTLESVKKVKQRKTAKGIRRE
jgi:hypothetical protein